MLAIFNETLQKYRKTGNWQISRISTLKFQFQNPNDIRNSHIRGRNLKELVAKTLADV